MSKYLLCIVAVFAFSFPVLGQQLPSKSQTAADSKAQQELTRKVQALLIETAQSARGLRNRENQVQIRFGIADLLWKDHEAAARLLYQEAFDNLRQALTDIDQSDPESSVGYDSLARLQGRALESLGKHDPMMARDLLRKSRPPVPPDTAKSDSSASDVPSVSGDRAPDTRLELSLAISMIDQSPKDAVRVAREALRRLPV